MAQVEDSAAERYEVKTDWSIPRLSCETARYGGTGDERGRSNGATCTTGCVRVERKENLRKDTVVHLPSVETQQCTERDTRVRVTSGV